MRVHNPYPVCAPGAALGEAKHFVWRILNMFDPGVSAVLAGCTIDSPGNAMLLAAELRDEFGRLRCYLDALPGRAHACAVKTTRGDMALVPGFAPRAGES